MLTVCGVVMEVVEVAVAMDSGVVVIVVVVVVVVIGLATRIQQRTPRLRPLAPSTPTCNGNGCGGLLFITSERIMLVSAYSTPLRGMKRSNPESGVTAVSIFWLWSLIFCL